MTKEIKDIFGKNAINIDGFDPTTKRLIEKSIIEICELQKKHDENRFKEHSIERLHLILTSKNIAE